MEKRIAWIAVFFFIFSLMVSSNVFAVGSAGIENASFSPKQLAKAGAGVANPDEPAAISYNPAGIVDLPGLQVQSNMHFLSIMTWNDSVTAGDTHSAGKIIPVPTGYMTLNPGRLLKDRVVFGIGSDFFCYRYQLGDYGHLISYCHTTYCDHDVRDVCGYIYEYSLCISWCDFKWINFW